MKWKGNLIIYKPLLQIVKDLDYCYTQKSIVRDKLEWGPKEVTSMKCRKKFKLSILFRFDWKF